MSWSRSNEFSFIGSEGVIKRTKYGHASSHDKPDPSVEKNIQEQLSDLCQVPNNCCLRAYLLQCLLVQKWSKMNKYLAKLISTKLTLFMIYDHLNSVLHNSNLIESVFTYLDNYGFSFKFLTEYIHGEIFGFGELQLTEHDHTKRLKEFLHRFYGTAHYTHAIQFVSSLPMQNKHTNPCGRILQITTIYKEHCRQSMDSAPVHVCCACDKRFTCGEALKNHVRHKIQEERAEHTSVHYIMYNLYAVCNKCSRLYRNQQHLKNHRCRRC